MSRTVLLAEDDEASRKLYLALLESEGYQVVDVGD
jgi:CheY-like chemotaxis protein